MRHFGFALGLCVAALLFCTFSSVLASADFGTNYGRWCGHGHGGFDDCCTEHDKNGFGSTRVACSECKYNGSVDACMKQCPPIDDLDTLCAHQDVCNAEMKKDGDYTNPCYHRDSACQCDCEFLKDLMGDKDDHLNDNGISVGRDKQLLEHHHHHHDICHGRPLSCHLAKWALKKSLCFFAPCWEESKTCDKLDCYWPAGMHCAKKQCTGELTSLLAEGPIIWKE
jgi:hypothetical protein